MIICFDAFSSSEELYKECNVKYHMACLSDKDDVEQKFYQNDMLFGGNSMFREIGYDNGACVQEGSSIYHGGNYYNETFKKD